MEFYIVLGILSLLTLFHPYFGIVIIMASLPLTNVLPSVGWANSVLTLLGGVTLASAILEKMRRKRTERRYSQQPPIILMGFLLLAWMFVSNPAAALIPDENGRIWAVTFVQLWVLAMLTPLLFDTPYKVRVLIWVYLATGVISAAYAVFAQGNVGSELSLADRAAGLAGGANTAARYFLFALILGLFLYQERENKTIRMLLAGGIIILFAGVVFTVSRTALILLIGGVGLFINQNIRSENRAGGILIVMLGMLVVWFTSDNITTILSGILPSIVEGTDTVDIRYRLWQAGWRMWLDHPLTGVGVGRFGDNLIKYAWDLLPSRYLMSGAHNMFFAMLSETGIVGLTLFIGMFAFSIKAASDVAKSRNVDLARIAKMWLVILVLVILAGLTKHDHYEKFNWIAVGVSAALSKMNSNDESVAKN